MKGQLSAEMNFAETSFSSRKNELKAFEVLRHWKAG
jgi:hypothetical protein